MNVAVTTRIDNHDKTLLIASVLMKKKSLKAYKTVFKHLRDRFWQEDLTNLQILSTDWESAISSAFFSIFNCPSTAQVVFCYVHLIRSFEKKAKSKEIAIWSEFYAQNGILYDFYNELKVVSYNNVKFFFGIIDGLK